MNIPNHPAPFALSVSNQNVKIPPPADDLAISKAWDLHLAKISDIEKRQFISYAKGDLTGYTNAMSAACKKQRRESRSFRIAEWFEPFFKFVRMYIPAASAALQAYPNPGSLILGGISCILQISENFTTYQERMATMLSRMGRKSEKLLQYDGNIYKNEPDVQLALVNALGDILDFCGTAYKLFCNERGEVKTGLKTLSLALYRPYEVKLGAIEKRFESDLEHVEDMAQACDKKRLHESLLRNHETTTQLTALTYGVVQFVNQQQIMEFQRRRNERDENLVKLRESIVQWLPTTPFHRHYDTRCAAHLPNTGDWLLEHKEYTDWKSQGNSSLLWVKGKPGCGKSVLAALTISDLEIIKEPGVATAYVFCKDEDAVRPGISYAVMLLCSLLRQLCQQYSGIDQVLKQIYDDSGPLQSEGPTSQQAIKSLTSIVSKFSQVFFIVDGLDECKIQDQADMACLLRSLVDESASDVSVKVIVFSRPDHFSLEDIFEGSKVIRVDHGENKEDIRTYICTLFDEDAASSVKEKKAIGEIRDMCLEKANGMFLWVSLLAKSLAGPLTTNQKLKKIKETPNDLKAMYELAMERVWKQEPEFRDLAVQALLWTTNAFRLLTEAEMLEALAIKPEADALDEGDRLEKAGYVVALCADLLYVNNEGCFDFVHISVKEFLTAILPDAGSPLSEYGKLQLDAHASLGDICLTYLRFDDINLGPVTTLAQVNEIRGQHPFLPYAAEYWGRHIAQGNAESRSKEAIRQFVDVPERRGLSMHFILLSDNVEMDVDDLWKAVGESTPLHVLAVFGLREAARETPDFHQLKTTPDGAGYLPLHYSLIGKSHDMCLLLLEHDAEDIGIDLDSLASISALHHATLLNWSDVVEKLIAAGMDVNKQLRSSGSTPLHIAAEMGAEAAALALLKAEANPNLQDLEGDSPLQLAAAGNCQGIAKALLANGANVNQCNANGVLPLHHAAQNGNIAITSLLLEEGADPSVKAKGWQDQSPMHFAARNNAHNIIKLLHKSKADIDGRASDNSTPLHDAAQVGANESVRLLISLGASLIAVDDDGYTALHYAAENGHIEVWKTLLSLNAKIDAVDTTGRTPLGRAASGGHTKIIRDYLTRVSSEEAKVMFNQADSKGQTVLHLSIEQNKPELVEMLLDNGSDATKNGVMSSSALHYAAHFGWTDLIPLLLKYGADVNAVNETKDTALHFAARQGHADFIETLLELRPAMIVNCLNSFNGTPLNSAAANGHSKVTELLLNHGALSTPDADQNLPIHSAAWGGFETVVQQLVSPENIRARGLNGRTALYASACGGYISLVQLLIKAGATVNEPDDVGFLPVWAALSSQHASVATFLLDCGADPRSCDSEGRSLLHIASVNGNVVLVKRLLDAHCSPLEKSKRGDTPFSNAVEADNIEIVDLFLGNGFNGCNMPCNLGITPIHLAAQQGSPEMLARLHKHGAKHGTKDVIRRNAMHFAASKGQYEIVHLLEKQENVWFDSVTTDNVSPLFEAASGGYFEFVELMLNKGANPNRQTTMWQATPLIVASQANATETVGLLLDYGADPYTRDVFGYNAIDYAASHPATMQKFFDQGHSRVSLASTTRRSVLQKTIVQSCDRLIEHLESPPLQEEFVRIHYLFIISRALVFLREESARTYAIPFLSEIFCPPSSNVWSWTYSCDLCGTKRRFGDQYVCQDCNDMVVLCSNCFERYQSGGEGPRSVPQSYTAMKKLEQELQRLRAVAQKYSSVITIAASLSTFQLLEAWLKDKDSEYEAWEREHNADGVYATYERPGQEFLKLVRETQRYLRSDGFSMELLRKIDQKYKAFDRKHKGDKEVSFVNCRGHDYLKVDENEIKAMKSQGLALDDKGQVTNSFIRDTAQYFRSENTTNVPTYREKLHLPLTLDSSDKAVSSQVFLEQASGNSAEKPSNTSGKALSSIGKVVEPSSLRSAMAFIARKPPITLPKPRRALTVAYIGLDGKHADDALVLYSDTSGRTPLQSTKSPERAFTEPATQREPKTRVIDVDAKVQTRLRQIADAISEDRELHPSRSIDSSKTEKIVKKHIIVEFRSETNPDPSANNRLNWDSKLLLSFAIDEEMDRMNDSPMAESVYSDAPEEPIESEDFHTDQQEQLAERSNRREEVGPGPSKLPPAVVLKCEGDDMDIKILVSAITMADAVFPGFAAGYVATHQD